LSVYNTAHELSRQLAKSDEYSAYRAARKVVESDPQMVWLLKDFRRRQVELQIKVASGTRPSDEEMKTYSSLAEAIGMHRLLSEFLTAEAGLMRVVADLQKIMIQSIDLWDYMEEPAEKGPQKAPETTTPAGAGEPETNIQEPGASARETGDRGKERPRPE